MIAKKCLGLVLVATLLLQVSCGSDEGGESDDNETLVIEADSGSGDAGDTGSQCGECSTPRPSCDNDVAVSYDVSCVDGSCQLGDEQREDCAAVGQVCSDGACVDPADPCANVSCTTPQSSCEGDILQEVEGTSTCNPDNGQCEGTTTTSTDCTEQGQICVDAECIAPPKRVFISAGQYTGDLRTAGGAATGHEGADALCATEAAAASLGGNWKAWISGEVDAVDRIEDVGPWYLVDNEQLVANNLAQLVTSGPQTNIDTKPDGTEIASGPSFDWNVWTGTRTNGRKTQDTCANWTSESESVIGISGYGDNTSSDWTDGLDFGCDMDFRLFCFEQ
jgi:hypothetical protein